MAGPLLGPAPSSCLASIRNRSTRTGLRSGQDFLLEHTALMSQPRFEKVPALECHDAWFHVKHRLALPICFPDRGPLLTGRDGELVRLATPPATKAAPTERGADLCLRAFVVLMLVTNLCHTTIGTALTSAWFHMKPSLGSRKQSGVAGATLVSSLSCALSRAAIRTALTMPSPGKRVQALRSVGDTPAGFT